MKYKNIVVTGGAGFIGSNFVRYLKETYKDIQITILDHLTYASSLKTIEDLLDDRVGFHKLDIANDLELSKHIDERVDLIVHFAAESFNDRSLTDTASFVQTNVLGTHHLLELARKYQLRFHQISTDEVYGDLSLSAPAFTEHSPYHPSSPYSASKAASDHLVHAWHRTYGLPVIITNSSNNYGAYQHAEKLIPLMISNAVMGKPLPIYGDGQQIRDWLFVEDHVQALYLVLTKGRVGENYNIGGNCEKTNLEVVKTICQLLEELAPNKPNHIKYYEDLMTFVKDRPGHDVRYSLDCSKIHAELGWQPQITFEQGLRQTVKWYLENNR